MEFYMGEDKTVMEETMKAFELLEQADNLGSIMKFDLSTKTRREMALRYKEWEEVKSDSSVKEILHSVALILVLTDRYTAVVTNPPYMSSSNMNPELSGYVIKNYPHGKSDMFSVFMLLNMDMIEQRGKLGMINMQSWMFLSSFENLRTTVIENYQIDSLLHLGPRTFDELGGEVVQNVSFVLSKTLPSWSGVYFRLIDGKGDPNVDRNRVAETILKERTSYEITSAQKIDPALIEEFLASWKDIFGQVGVSYSHDSSELFQQCREDNDSPINKIASNYRVYASELSKCSAFTLAQVLEDAISFLIIEANSKRFMQHIHRRIMEHVNKVDEYRRPYVFLYGIGNMYPYLRTSTLLNKYEEFNESFRYKIILFYPGEQEGNSFRLFSKLEDHHTYRAIVLMNE